MVLNKMKQNLEKSSTWINISGEDYQDEINIAYNDDYT